MTPTRIHPSRTFLALERLCREVERWKGLESPLLALERRRYLDALHGAVAGLDDARHALAVAAQRLEGEGR